MAFADPGGDTFAPGDPPAGICVAFDDPPLEADPTWTRLDDPIGYRFASSFEIQRGRNRETDKTDTGTASVALRTTSGGELDPTNAGAPFVGKLKPTLQAAIARWNPVTGTWATRFRGFIKTWGWTMDRSGNVTNVRLGLVDAFDLFADIAMTPGDYGDPVVPGSDGWIHYRGGPGWQRQVNRRIEEVLDDIGWPSSRQIIFSGNVTVQDRVYDRNASPMEPLLEAADAEWPGVANIFCDADGAVRFRGRFARFAPESPGYGTGFWTVGSGDIADLDSSVVPIGEFPFSTDKEDVINSSLATPLNVDELDPNVLPGQLVEDATSIAAHGTRSLPLENLITYYGIDETTGDFTTALEEVKRFSTYYVDNYADPELRIDSLTFKVKGPDTFSGPAMWAMANGVEIGDVVTVHTTHEGGGGFDEVDFFVEGIHETDAPIEGARHEVEIELDLSPRAFYDTGEFVTGADNDDMANAQWVLTLFDGITNSMPGRNIAYTNELNDANTTTSKDPIVQEFGDLYDTGQEYDGVDAFNGHNFTTAWYRWKAPAGYGVGSTFGVGVTDQSARCCLLLCTIGSGPPPNHGDYTVLDSDHVALADTAPFTDLAAAFTGTVSAGDTVYIGVGVLDDVSGADYTLTWEWNA